MKSEKQRKLERKIIEHRDQKAGYHFQLPAYVTMIRRANAVPILDSNTVTLLEALTDLLGKITEFDGYCASDSDELDLSGLDVSFSLGCNYCDERGFNVLQAVDHIMTDSHPLQTDKKMMKLQRFHACANDSYQTFLLQKQELMIESQLLRSSFDSMIDLCFVTQIFLKRTSQYLESMNVLKRVPSTIIARGVVDLLNQIDSLVSRAKRIESVPGIHKMMGHLHKCHVEFVINGKMFGQVQAAINHAAGLKAKLVTPVERNIRPFSQKINNQPQPNGLVGSALMANSAMPPGSNVLSSIRPFTAGPPIRMMQPQMSVTAPPMMRVPLIRGGVNIKQQRIQQMQVNPSAKEIPKQIHSMVFQQKQQQLLPLPNTNGGGADLQTALNSLQLLPLNDAGTTESPIISAELKRFLEKPHLDSLIEKGNHLIKFDKFSIIPGELACALKAVVPNVRVECFGAKVSGVGYEEDYVNLFVDDAKKPKTVASVKLLFDELMSFFSGNSDEWLVQNTTEAGVRTHLTVNNSCENLCCRISFASEIFCSNSKLIRYYMCTFPMCQKLCYFVQECVKLIDLDFNRHVIVVLVVFYLQIRDFLPTVAQLQSNLTQEEMCGPWLINFVPKTPAELKLKDCETDLRKCATDFFQFYGKEFSFQSSVVSPQIGLAVNRSYFFPKNIKQMSLKRNKVYLEACQAFATAPMCVQSLLELTTNISGSISASDTGKFVRLCKMAYEFYSNNQ